MKILVVCQHYWPEPYYLSDVCEELVRRGHEGLCHYGCSQLFDGIYLWLEELMVHVFIVGSKGIPARYGGFETFVEELTKGKRNNSIQYHVSCMSSDEKHFCYNGADCFNVKVPLPGAPGRILHVGLVLHEVEKWVRLNRNETVIVYILGCRVGPLLIPYAKTLKRAGVKIFCNPIVI